MKIILKYIVTNIWERKARTAVMLLSILLSSTLLFVSFSIGVSYESAQRKMARGMTGSATVSVTGAEKGITPDDIPNLSEIHAMAGILEASSLYHEDGYYENVDLIAADLEELNKINKPRLVDDSEISGFSGNQIILPDRFTSKYGIEKGNSITLQLNGNPFTFQVAEIAAYDTVFLRHTRGATALVPLSALRSLTGQSSGYERLLLEPAKDITTDELISQLSARLPSGSFHVEGIVNEAQITADARQKSMPFFLISFFAMTMSIFIIYSSYKVITLDRLPVIGTFRSIGATQKTVTRLLLLESVLYGCLGGAVGIPAGILVLKVILQEMGQSLSKGIAIPSVISLPGTLLSFLTAVIASLVSAWLPVRRASRLPVKDIILGAEAEKRCSRRFIVTAGILLFVVSAFLPHMASGSLLYIAGGFSLVGLIAAAILLIPLLTNAFSKGMEHLYGLFPGNEGRLAARNMQNNKNINQNITLLFISISAVIAISVVGSFVTTYITDVFRGAELSGFADGHMEPDFVEQVQNMEGIEKVLPVYVFDNKMEGNGISITRLEATDNLESYNSMFALHYTNEDMETQAADAFSQKRALILSEDYQKRAGISVGDSLILSDGSKQAEYTVAGSFKSRATDVEAVIPSAYAISDFHAAAYDFLAYTASDPDAVMLQIRNLFGETQNWSRTVEEFITDALSTVSAFLKPMHSMTYFILLLAATGIVNNLLINYLQKRRIIAMYKSVGLSNRQNLKMTLIVGFSSGFIGAVIAIFVSYMEIQTIFLAAGPRIALVPELDSQTFFIAGLMGIVITLLGCAVPIFKRRHAGIKSQKQTNEKALTDSSPCAYNNRQQNFFCISFVCSPVFGIPCRTKAIQGLYWFRRGF